MSSFPHIPLVDQIDALLPQTQCGKCKTPGCRPYAEEIAAGAPINRCVPGGADTIADLAVLLGRPVLPLDPAYGTEPATRRVAFIREIECIGCTKCLQVCPVDAIVGAAKWMHTMLIDECTGCDLCIPPCPVDCIEIHDLPKVTDRAEKRVIAAHNRQRFEARKARLARDKTAALSVPAPVAGLFDSAASASGKSLVIAAALARTNLKKAQRHLANAEAANAADTVNNDTAVLRAEVQRLQAEVEALEAEQKRRAG